MCPTNILNHNVFQLVQMAVHPRNGIEFSCVAVMFHLVRQYRREFRVHCVRDGRGRLQAILQQKAPLDLVEEEERTGTLELIVRDAHVDDAILADEVDQVVAVRVRQFVVVCRNGFDDLFGDFGKVADALGIFGQHNGPARYYTV